MKRRSGFTLVEVLIAIFIMAIGLLALLTLFPLGALRMSQALTYDRAGTAANEAANIFDAFNLRHDPQYDPPAVAGNQPPSLFMTPPTAGFPTAAQNGGGIPIYVDPNGLANGPLGGPGSYLPQPPPVNAGPGITRVTPSTSPPQTPGSGVILVNANGLIPEPGAANPGASVAARYFTLLDDMTFFTNGQPDTSNGVLPRGDRYTWAYLLHRSPPYSSSGLVDMQVVVYAGRPTLAGGEATYAASGASQQTSVTLTHPAGLPPTIRRGSWILDTSYEDKSTITPQNPVPTLAVHGDFYRVVSVATIDNSHVNLELQDPISKMTGISAVTVMDNVVEVFKRGTGPSNQWEQFHAQP